MQLIVLRRKNNYELNLKLIIINACYINNLISIKRISKVYSVKMNDMNR